MSPRRSAVPAPESGLVTVRSIADAAGVSIGSVSSVLNHREVERRISPETVERIRRAAARLGYVPNVGARLLRRGQGAPPNVILALMTSYEAPLSLVKHFVTGLREVADEFSAQAGSRSYSLLIEMFAAGRLEKLPGLLAGDHYNAAIITNTTTEDDAFLARTRLPFPTVLANRLISGYASVSEKPVGGARAAEILFRQGRRRLAVLHGKPLTQVTRQRAEGFVAAARELTGVAPREIVASGLTEEAAATAMARVLRRNPEMDGLYTVNDGMALGAYYAIKQSGRSMPESIAVVGVGDLDNSRYFDPPLSCVGVSHPELARSAARLLLRQLHEGKTDERVELALEEHRRAPC